MYVVVSTLPRVSLIYCILNPIFLRMSCIEDIPQAPSRPVCVSLLERY
jgi:hypothetical protein